MATSTSASCAWSKNEDLVSTPSYIADGVHIAFEQLQTTVCRCSTDNELICVAT